MGTNSESYIQDSTMMSTELGNMGYNDKNRRMKKELLVSLHECRNIYERAVNDGIQKCCVLVGSQIECTALLDSDYDILLGPSTEHVAAISSLSDKRDGRENILIVRNEMSPPGYAWLKIIHQTPPILSRHQMLQGEIVRRIRIQSELFSEFYNPLEEVPDVDKHFICKWPGILFLDDQDLQFYIPNSIYTLIGTQLWANKAIRTGPSFSFNNNDVVRPICCDNIYPRDQDPIKIEGKLYGNLCVPKEYPCSFVPVGHPESKDSMLEWRISYNLTEREIMLRLNITHIQTNVVLKMLQRRYFRHFVGKDFTSYHCKTALYHTIASNVTTIWREDNLINCVRQCLKTIQIFLKKRFCPHFFNKALNIFSGKLPRCGIHWDKLIVLVDLLVENPNSYLLCIEEENKHYRGIQIVPSEYYRFVMFSAFVVEQVNTLIIVSPLHHVPCHRPIRPDNIREKRIIYKNLRRKIEEHSRSGQDKKSAEVILSFVKVRHYLHSAAYLLEQGKTFDKPLPDNILPDALSMDLQMSSLQFVYGNYEQCRLLLDRVFLKTVVVPIAYVQWHEDDNLISHSDIKDFFHRYNSPLQITDIPAWTFIKRHVSLPVIFPVHELCLLHPLLRFEAYRFLFENRMNWSLIDLRWWCFVRLDSIPFLFFMQYLVYKELGLDEQKYEALVRLEVCIYCSSMSYPHIAMNMFGICCELERNYDKAFSYYARSLEKRPRFNAAIFHMALLVWRLWVKHNVELLQDGIFLNVLNIVD